MKFYLFVFVLHAVSVVCCRLDAIFAYEDARFNEFFDLESFDFDAYHQRSLFSKSTIHEKVENNAPKHDSNPYNPFDFSMNALDQFETKSIEQLDPGLFFSKITSLSHSLPIAVRETYGFTSTNDTFILSPRLKSLTHSASEQSNFQTKSIRDLLHSNTKRDDWLLLLKNDESLPSFGFIMILEQDSLLSVYIEEFPVFDIYHRSSNGKVEKVQAKNKYAQVNVDCKDIFFIIPHFIEHSVALEALFHSDDPHHSVSQYMSDLGLVLDFFVLSVNRNDLSTKPDVFTSNITKHKAGSHFKFGKDQRPPSSWLCSKQIPFLFNQIDIYKNINDENQLMFNSGASSRISSSRKRSHSEYGAIFFSDHFVISSDLKISLPEKKKKFESLISLSRQAVHDVINRLEAIDKHVSKYGGLICMIRNSLLWVASSVQGSPDFQMIIKRGHRYFHLHAEEGSISTFSIQKDDKLLIVSKTIPISAFDQQYFSDNQLILKYLHNRLCHLDGQCSEVMIFEIQ